MSTIRIEHLARVEGHGGITVELDGAAVRQVRFDIFEGARLLEALVRGKSCQDVSPMVSRICAICSVAHALTSLQATEAAFGVEISSQTALLRDLLFRGESIESHALHLFCLALPDYLNYPSVIAMAADLPDAVRLGLRLKKLGNMIQETIGGRAVHPVNAVLGGFGRLPATGQLVALRTALRQGMSDAASMIDIMSSLPAADFCQAEPVFAALRPPGDYGYCSGDGILVVSNGDRETIPTACYRELTNEKSVAHSHAKHSSFRGRPLMVGALARLTANRDKLPPRGEQLMERVGLVLPSANPMDNNKAQAVELALDIEYALKLVERLLEEGVAAEHPAAFQPRAGAAVAATEAPRGLLIHSYVYDAEGRITAADVITPTAINAAGIEEHLRRAVEQSPDKEPASLTRRLEMIARAYDPCISCSVHVMRLRA